MTTRKEQENKAKAMWETFGEPKIGDHVQHSCSDTGNRTAIIIDVVRGMLSSSRPRWHIRYLDNKAEGQWLQCYTVRNPPNIHIGSYVKNIGGSINKDKRGYVVGETNGTTHPMFHVEDKPVDGKHIGTWFQKSCVPVSDKIRGKHADTIIVDDIKDDWWNMTDKLLAIKPEHYNPCKELHLGGIRRGESLQLIAKGRQYGKSTAFAEAMKYANHIMDNMVETTKPEDYLRHFETKSEEDKPMQLLIQDKVTINGCDAAKLSDDTLIENIRQAEDQINSYKAIKAESNAITAKIKQLEAGVVRLVEILDKSA